MNVIKTITYSALVCLALVWTTSSHAQTPGTVKWTYRATNAISGSGAAVDTNQTLYFSDLQNMYAVNSNGSSKWTAASPAGFAADNSPALSADGQTVYFVLYDVDNSGGGLTARSTSDGSQRWTYSAEGGDITGPAIGPDGTVYFITGGVPEGESNNLVALTSSGTLKWTVGFTDFIFGGPTIGPDGTIYVGSDELYGFNPDGSSKVTYSTGGAAVMTPVFGTNGTIYVGSFGGLFAFNTNGTSWEYTDTTLRAQFPAQFGSAIDSNGVIYFQSFGYLYAINSDGTLKWRFSTENTEQYSYLSCPAIAADGTIYIGSPSFKLYAVYPNGTLDWSYTTGNKIYAPITIGSDGTVYFGSEDTNFYALYGSAPLATNSPAPKYHFDLRNSGNDYFPPPPPTPTNVVAVAYTHIPGPLAGCSNIINWSESGEAMSYNVKRSTTYSGPFTNLANITTNIYIDYNVTNNDNTNFFYVVSAINYGIESSNSLPVGPVPMAPLNLQAKSNPGSGMVQLQWTTTYVTTQYHVKRSTTNGGPYTVAYSVQPGPSPTQACNDTNVVSGTTYYYVVSALNSNGESANSSQISCLAR